MASGGSSVAQSVSSLSYNYEVEMRHCFCNVSEYHVSSPTYKRKLPRLPSGYQARGVVDFQTIKLSEEVSSSNPGTGSIKKVLG